MIIQITARHGHNVLHVYHNTYPNHPKHCVPVKLGSVPYKRERFTSKKNVFEQVARQFGLDTTHARYIERIETPRGIRTDLTKLIIPAGDDGSYYSIGFFS